MIVYVHFQSHDSACAPHQRWLRSLSLHDSEGRGNVSVKSTLLFSPLELVRGKMWTGEVMNGWLWVWVGPRSHSSLLRHTVVPPQCRATRAPSFSSFATIVNHDTAFLKCHSRTYWCARWTQLQMRQVEWCQWPKAMRCWEKTRAVKVFFSFSNAKYSCLGANPPYARYSIMFLADRCSCRFFLDELFVFAARGEGFDVELVFFTYYHKYWLITIFCWHEKQRSPGVYFFLAR